MALQMYEHLLFFLYWFFNSLAIYLLGVIFPSSVVLGTWRLTSIEASLYAGFWLTFFVWTMWEFMLVRKVKLEPCSLRFIFFLAVNFVGVWIVSRYAYHTGLGIVSFWWALLIGTAANLLQLASWRLFGKRLKG
jgi:hypothetical protein